MIAYSTIRTADEWRGAVVTGRKRRRVRVRNQIISFRH